MTQEEIDNIVDQACALIGWCPCGNAEEGIKDIARLLEAIDTIPKVQIFLEQNFPAKMHFMDSAGLLQHGGSLGGAWVSPKGKEFHALAKPIL